MPNSTRRSFVRPHREPSEPGEAASGSRACAGHARLRRGDRTPGMPGAGASEEHAAAAGERCRRRAATRSASSGRRLSFALNACPHGRSMPRHRRTTSARSEAYSAPEESAPSWMQTLTIPGVFVAGSNPVAPTLRVSPARVIPGGSASFAGKPRLALGGLPALAACCGLRRILRHFDWRPCAAVKRRTGVGRDRTRRPGPDAGRSPSSFRSSLARAGYRRRFDDCRRLIVTTVATGPKRVDDGPSILSQPRVKLGYHTIACELLG
jgi:hypothetical protein